MTPIYRCRLGSLQLKFVFLFSSLERQEEKLKSNSRDLSLVRNTLHLTVLHIRNWAYMHMHTYVHFYLHIVQ